MHLVDEGAANPPALRQHQREPPRRVSGLRAGRGRRAAGAAGAQEIPTELVEAGLNG